MAKKKKKRYAVNKPLTYKGKFYEVGKSIYLTIEEEKVLINKNLIK